jgi:YidC/Oxa1 family membrane protein insertase
MFSLIGQIFHTFLYQPLFNALILIYQILPGHDLGLAVILLTLVVKAITLPLEIKAFRFQQKMAVVQPKLKEIQEKYKNNLEEQTKAVSALWREEKINPLTSLVPLFVQIPILIALYQVFGYGLWNLSPDLIYPFIVMPGTISPLFLGLVDLSKPQLLLAVLAGIGQFFQAKTAAAISQPKATNNNQGRMTDVLQKEMLFLFPLMTVFILWKLGLPSALALYWTTSSVLITWQQKFLNKKPQL